MTPLIYIYYDGSIVFNFMVSKCFKWKSQFQLQVPTLQTKRNPSSFLTHFHMDTSAYKSLFNPQLTAQNNMLVLPVMKHSTYIINWTTATVYYLHEW